MGVTLQEDGKFYKQLLCGAGFDRVEVKKIYLDSSGMRRLHHDECLDSFGKGYIGFGLQKDSADLEAQLAAVRNALRDSAVGISFPAIICYAQKPLDGTAVTDEAAGRR
jgi:hypothetical protein